MLMMDDLMLPHEHSCGEVIHRRWGWGGGWDGGEQRGERQRGETLLQGGLPCWYRVIYFIYEPLLIFFLSTAYLNNKL